MAARCKINTFLRALPFTKDMLLVTSDYYYKSPWLHYSGLCYSYVSEGGVLERERVTSSDGSVNF